MVERLELLRLSPRLSTLNLPTLRSSLPTGAVESRDGKEEPATYSDSDPDWDQTTEDDELAFLQRDSIRMDAEEAALTAQRKAELRRKIARQPANNAALQRAVVDVGLRPTSPAASTAAGVPTPGPVPASLRPRVLFSSPDRGAPSATVVAHLAALERPPNLAAASGAGAVVIAPIAAVGGSGSGASSKRFGDGGHDSIVRAINSLQGELSDEEEGAETAPSQGPKAQVYGFRVISFPNDGRYKLSEKEQRMLYDEKRCYRCYGQHPVGLRAPPCMKAVMKVAPRPLH